MRKVILITIFLISTIILFAQNNEKPIDTRPLNNVSLNLLGDASMISINYERQFLIHPIFIVSSKVGLGYNQEFQLFRSSTPTNKFLTIPYHVTGNLGKGRHFFEFGLGGTIVNGNTSQPYFFYPIIGYRILPLKSKKINFRIFGQLPFSGFHETEDILFYPVGLNIGISF